MIKFCLFLKERWNVTGVEVFSFRAETLSRGKDLTMYNLFRRLFGGISGRAEPAAREYHPEEVQVLVPEAVELPLPKAPQEEISVPASINGRDLSSGRL
jgi:hypothetical protein